MENFILQADNTPQNIPPCRFIENVETFVGNRDAILMEETCRQLLMKYRYMKRSMSAQLEIPKGKIPHLSDTLEAIAYLKGRRQANKNEPFQVHFNLSSILHSKASVQSTDRTYLWLGANTMLEYTLDEAEEVLQKNLGIFKDAVETLQKDLEWLQTQICTAEVNVARLHNFCVRQRQTNEQAAD